MKSHYGIIALILIGLFGQSCISDLRTKSLKKEGLTIQSNEHGKVLLESAWKRQGYDVFAKHKVYAFRGHDIWKGPMGKMGQIWGETDVDLEFKYAVNTFDGRVSFLDGERKGTSVGLQNWNYYETNLAGETSFPEADKRVMFGIPAFQYFTEMVGRLRTAPIISYAGEDEFRDKTFDLVFCSWGSEEPHVEADQYLVWICKETGLVEVVQYTIRENYLKTPGYKMVYGAVEYDKFKEVEGVNIAHRQTVYVFNPKKNMKKFLHQVDITEFAFDSFDINELSPSKDLEKGGNFKVSVD